MLLGIGAGPYIPFQIDDSYIVYAYAHNIVDLGSIIWNTGERVEGYSSPTHLAIMAAAAYAHLDLSMFSRLISMLAAFGTLLVLSNGTMGTGRYAVVLLLAAWQPFQFWSTGGLETAAACLLGLVAWRLSGGDRDSWAKGIALLTLYSLTRPEGLAWLAIACLRWFASPRKPGRPEFVAIASIGSLLLYHATRTWYFGAFLPTPFLAKLVAPTAHGIGVMQAVRELASASGLLLAATTFRSMRWTDLLNWSPLWVQLAVLIAANGDWMGNGRFLLPGLIASIGATLTWSSIRTPTRLRLSLVVLLGALGFATEPSRVGHTDTTPSLVPRLRPLSTFTEEVARVSGPWETPLLGDVSLMVATVPTGWAIAMTDVGLPGNLDDIPVIDNSGLTDRLVARALSGERGEFLNELGKRYTPQSHLWCFRTPSDPKGEGTSPDPLDEYFPRRTDSRSAANQQWHCRDGTAPTTEVMVGRWELLRNRFPSQDWLRWHEARLLFESHRDSEAVAIAAGATIGREEPIGWAALGDGIPAHYVPGRGWAQLWNGELTSVEAVDSFWRGCILQVDVDDPGEDGANVELHWSDGCGTAVHAAVERRTTIDLPSCAKPGRRGIVLGFTNDTILGSLDRNAYFSLDCSLSPRGL